VQGVVVDGAGATQMNLHSWAVIRAVTRLQGQHERAHNIFLWVVTHQPTHQTTTGSRGRANQGAAAPGSGAART
jgi:hypothetical protein